MILFFAFLIGLTSAILFPYFIEISFWWSPLFFLGGVLTYAILLAIIFYILPKTVFRTPSMDEPVRRNILHEICRFTQSICGIKIRVTGLDIIPTGNTLVFVGNHYANWDIIVMMFVLKKYKVSFVYKSDIDKWPYIGMWAKIIGGMPVYRDNDRKSAEIIVEVGKRVKDGHNYIVFPEGTRSRNGYLADFRHGAVKPAIKGAADVVYFSIDNTYKVTYNWPRRTIVHVDFIKAIKGEDISKLTTIQLAEDAKVEITKRQEENRAIYKELIVPNHIRTKKNRKFKRE